MNKKYRKNILKTIITISLKQLKKHTKFQFLKFFENDMFLNFLKLNNIMNF